MADDNSKGQWNVRLPKDLIEQIQAIAEVDGVNPSDLAEEAMHALVQRRKADQIWLAKYREWAGRQEASHAALRSAFGTGGSDGEGEQCHRAVGDVRVRGGRGLSCGHQPRACRR